MPRRDVPRTMLAILALLVVVLSVAPVFDAPAKGKRDGKRDEATAESRRADRGARRDEGAGRADREQSRDRTRRERNQSDDAMADDAMAAELSAPWLPAADAPYFNHELIAAAAAAGEIYDPAPPPVPTRAWDDEAAELVVWQPVARIDSGLTGDQVEMNLPQAPDRGGPVDDPASESPFTHGWVRTALLLQDELAGDSSPPTNDPADQQPESDELARDVPAPVPVEEGLVVTDGAPAEESVAETQQDLPIGSGGPLAAEESLDAPQGAAPRDGERRERRSRQERGARDEGRGRVRPARAENSARRDVASTADAAPNEPRASRAQKRLQDWSGDQYFAGGSAIAWGAGLAVAGTNDDVLYLTQRTGSGTGERRGFTYAIPVDVTGMYLVRLYLAEPYWGAPGAPADGDGRRVFSVTGEGEVLLADLDIYAEAGPLTALVQEAEVEVNDGELNLGFTATAGEPLVAAIEVLVSAS